ncbi:MAG: NAD-dependent deacylase [Syntrophobacterales bacterium]|nr:NAD-dependent deacylase [Syntrophobacterales bacterium]
MKNSDEAISQAAEYILKARYLTALTGSGISAESGIPTFRGKDGLWNRYRPEDLATPEAFRRDPEVVWRWYAWRMERVWSANPNPAHYALRELEEMGLLKCLITQNVDDLHERAGSGNVVHIHGSIKVVRCVGCGKCFDLASPPIIPPLPTCGCGALLRPGVVWFGEAIPSDVLERSFAEAAMSDVMIVVGTSALVYPAASLPLVVKKKGGSLIEINPEETPLTGYGDISLRENAGSALSKIVHWINRLRG